MGISFDNFPRVAYLFWQRPSSSMHSVKSLHIVALVTALAAVILPGCRERPDRLAWWEAEQERIELSQRLALAQYQQRNSPTDHTSQLRELQATTRNLAQRARDLAQSRTTLSAEIQELETQLDQLARDALKDQRLSAIGVKYETLALANGKIFHDAVVTGVDEVGVAIRHRDGLARLRCADLSPDQREFFGLDEAAALAAETRERHEALAYERLIDQGMDAVRKQEEIARATAKREEETANLTRALLLAQATSQQRVSPLAQPSSTGWSNRWNHYTRDPYRRYHTVYYYPYVPYRNTTFSASRINPVRNTTNRPYNPRITQPTRPATPCPTTPAAP